MRALFAAVLLTLSISAHAAERPIIISDAWVRASLGKVPTTAAYVRIENHGPKEDKLLSVSTPVAAMAHVHNSATNAAGVVQMLPVTALSVKPGETVALSPGGLHIMVMNVKEPLKVGGTVPLTLKFEQAGEITVEAEVRGLDGKPLKR